MPDYPFHEVSNIFPLMQGEDFRQLVEDIKVNGLREPIWLFEEYDKPVTIIDGRNRYRACQEIGIEPDYRVWAECQCRICKEYFPYYPDAPLWVCPRCDHHWPAGREDCWNCHLHERTKADFLPRQSLTAFIVSLNLQRRHLSESQRAMVAAKIANLEKGRPELNRPIGRFISQPDAAELLNVSERSIRRARVVLDDGALSLIDKVQAGDVAVSIAANIATLPEDEQDEIVARGEAAILRASKEIRAQRAEDRRQERFEKFAELAAPTLDGVAQYPILYADPPWRYDYAESDTRIIENQYPTMDLADICALPVATVATEDCLLFLWVTSPKLEDALQVLHAWGFSYRTCMVWVKDKIGMGYYARQQHELLLIAKKGEPPMPHPAQRPPSVIIAPRVGHSTKPEEFYRAIEQMYPDIHKLELFARTKREGWDQWGNQA